ATDFEITNLSVKDADTDWMKGTGWIVHSGVAHCDGSQGAESLLYQAQSFDSGNVVLYKFTISNYSAGGVYVRYGPYSSLFSANGTYEVLGVNSNYNFITIIANSTFIGDIDNVSVHKLTFQKEIAGSTNYTGDHYVLPVDENDFAIPVDYVAEGIVAQKFGGETNATAGFTSVGLDGTGANKFESQDSVKNVGEFALHADANDTPTHQARAGTDMNTVWGLSPTKIYRISVNARHIGSGGIWVIFLSDSPTVKNVIASLDNSQVTFQTYVYYWTHDSTHRVLLLEENSATDNGGVYVDALTIRPVTFP
ncbi:hypothetical protein LCGC14_2377550, partial [marine sediment metagenome]